MERMWQLLLRGRKTWAAFLFPVVVVTAMAQNVWAEGEGNTVRAEVGKSLQAAQELIKGQKYKEALAKVRETDAISGKTPYEVMVVERIRGIAASRAGEYDVAAKAFESVVNGGKLPTADQLNIVMALADAYYRSKDYAKAASWTQRYFKEGGTNGQMRSLLTNALYLAGDYAGAAKEINAELAAGAEGGHAPAEERLQLLGNCYLKLNDKVGYVSALEKLVTHYPKKEYWNDLLARLQKKPGFSDRLSLDVYRLMMATGNLKEAGDYMEMAQLAMQAGLPAEAKRVAEEGYAKGVLGGGGDAERHKRLRDLATKQAADDQKSLTETEKQAKDGTSMVAVGAAYVSLRQFDKGIALFEQGIAKGGLKRPEDAKLHLGIALMQAGNKAKATQVLHSVEGKDGTADIARLWVLQGGH